MSKRTHSLKILAVVMLGLSTGGANALPFINGAISASGGLTQLGTTNFIVSQLNVLNGLGTGVANTGTGDYSLIPNGTAAILDPLDISSTFAMFGTTIFNIGNFTFTGGKIFTGPVRNPLQGIAGNLSDAVTLRFIGEVSAPGFENTGYLADFTGSGNCVGNNGASTGPCISDISGAWSVSISSNGQPLVLPEPTSLALFGIGLVAMAANRRRLSAKPAAAK